MPKEEFIRSWNVPNLNPELLQSMGDSICPVDPAEVPGVVSTDLYENTRSKVGGQIKIEDFDSLSLLKYDDLSTAYFATYTLSYADGRTAEINTWTVDVSPNLEITGRGRIRFIPPSSEPSTQFTGFPFVGWNQTEEDFKENGLGMRRLLAMGAFANKAYGIPLHSGTGFLEPTTESFWRELVKCGVADSPSASNSERYTYSFRAL